ncbi:MAG: OmpA family protein [Sedimentisphaerales bacterium]|nr:OmpA family protein [Sedimentisphaerales bacterium]
MSRKRSAPVEDKMKVPGYIVTFSDMVTLLLTFFVLLLTLADTQDAELFNRGRDSFIESMKYMGLGMLFGRSAMSFHGEFKTKHSVENPDESAQNRTIDARAEELRRIQQQLKQRTTIMPSPIVGDRTDYSITNVRFSPGSDDLNESAKKFLTGFCRDLQQDISQKKVILYVLGLASEGQSEREQWLLSARRAKNVEDFLQNTLSSLERNGQSQGGRLERESKYTIYSWGGGPGEGWADRDSPISQNSQILIAVLRDTD